MSMGLNTAYLIGRVGRDPEATATPAGLDVVKVRLATPAGYKKDGQWVEDTDWHSLIAYGHVAQLLAECARKGDQLAVECRIRQRRWVGKDDVTRYATDIVVKRVLWYQGAAPNALIPVDPRAGEADDVPWPTDEDFRGKA